MIVVMATTIVLTEAERMELNQLAASRNGRADDARRARLILLLKTAAPGKRYETSWIATTPSLIAG
jgi:hypothetical protein